MSTAAGLLTFAEFERLADEANTLELLHEELIRVPAPRTAATKIEQPRGSPPESERISPIPTAPD